MAMTPPNVLLSSEAPRYWTPKGTTVYEHPLEAGLTLTWPGDNQGTTSVFWLIDGSRSRVAWDAATPRHGYMLAEVFAAACGAGYLESGDPRTSEFVMVRCAVGHVTFGESRVVFTRDPDEHLLLLLLVDHEVPKACDLAACPQLLALVRRTWESRYP